MIRELKRYVVQTAGGEKEYIEMTMDHDDTKPAAAGYVNGSKIIETDTGDVYMLNEDAGEWVKEYSLQNLGGGGGSGLPDVTADDNGDVLTVVEGAWAKKTPSGALPSVTFSDNGKMLVVKNNQWVAAVYGGFGIVFTKPATGAATCSQSFDDLNRADSLKYGIYAELVVTDSNTPTYACIKRWSTIDYSLWTKTFHFQTAVVDGKYYVIDFAEGGTVTVTEHTA